MSNGHDALLVIVDQLSKIAHYILTTVDITSKGLAYLYIDHVFCLYGIPDSVISDWGTQLVSEFTKALCSLTGLNRI